MTAVPFAIASLALSGCGSILGGGDSADKGEKSFTYWSSWSQGEPQQKVLAKAIEGFTAETGVKVNVQWVGRDAFKKLSPTLNTATTPADLIDGAQRNVKSVLLSTGNAGSLNDLYTQKPDGETQPLSQSIPSRYTDLVTTNGETWMVPYEVASSGFWYNTATLGDLSAKAPATWEDLVALLQKSKDAGHAPLAADGDIAAYNLYYFAELVVAELGPGALNKAAGDKTGEALKDPAILKAAQRIEELVKKGFFAEGYKSSKFPALQQKWAANKADFMYNGSWLPSETTSYLASGFKVGYFPMPSAQNSAEAYLIGFATPKKGAHLAEAKQFINYFMAKSRLQAIATDTANLTPRSDIEAPAVLAGVKKALDTSTKIHGQWDGVVDDYADWATKVLQPQVNELLFGKKSAEDFAKDLPKESKDFWSTNG